MQSPEIIKKQIENVQAAGDYWWKKPWPFSVMFMIVCCFVVYVLMNNVNKDVKAERDLYKNIVLKTLEKAEDTLQKAEMKVSIIENQLETNKESLDSIITKHERK